MPPSKPLSMPFLALSIAPPAMLKVIPNIKHPASVPTRRLVTKKGPRSRPVTSGITMMTLT